MSMSHILIVEDDKFLLKAFSAKFLKEGFEVTIAEDGEAAIEAMRKKRPDLVLLDLVLPNKHGFQVLEEIRGDEKLKDLKVIVVSNSSSPAGKERSLALGALEYLVKSNTPIDDMVAKVRRYLK